MTSENIARVAQPTRTSQRHSRPWAATAGWALIGAALALVGYVVVAVTLGAGFEQDLAAAAERDGVAVNAVATSTQAQIAHDHALYALITGLFLLLPRCSCSGPPARSAPGREDGSPSSPGGWHWPH